MKYFNVATFILKTFHEYYNEPRNLNYKLEEVKVCVLEKIVEVSDEIKEKVIKQTRKNVIDGFGMGDGSGAFNTLIKKHAQTLQVGERASAMWILT